MAQIGKPLKHITSNPKTSPMPSTMPAMPEPATAPATPVQAPELVPA